MSKIKVGLISLGCDKNRIDSEIILNLLNTEGSFEIVNNPKIADVIIVNTCGFIESAKQESIDTILEMNEYKKRYKCQALVVTGCLSQRYKDELLKELPEIDIMLGVNDYNILAKTIIDFLNKKDSAYFICNQSNANINEGNRILTTLPHTAYLRIAEGCDNFCTYCVIPKIRGKYRSRKFENIIEEANLLAERGVKEIILVAQDTTKYGTDLYGEKKLHELIDAISKIESIKWIRVLYCYPEEIYDELIYTIASNDKVCKYMDIPLQHISDNILKRMGRRGRKEDILQTISKLRKNVNNICLRTSVIVGFPGETEEDFAELRDFVADIKFDNLGVFKYSQEEDTPAANMENQISDEVKEKRYNELMRLQQKISRNKNKNKIGQIYEVIIDGFKDGQWIARSCEMLPDVDGIIYINSKYNLGIGSIIKVKIIDSMEYDLRGEVYYEFS